MNMWRSVAGTMELELTTANPEGIIAGFSDMGIAVKQFRQIGVLTYAFSCDRKDYKKAAVLCKKKGDTLRVCRRKGLYWSINKVFSQKQWKIEQAEKHSIICTASGYPLKGYSLRSIFILFKNYFPAFSFAVRF